MIKEWEKPAIVDLLGYLYWNSSWLVAYEAALSHTFLVNKNIVCSCSRVSQEKEWACSGVWWAGDQQGCGHHHCISHLGEEVDLEGLSEPRHHCGAIALPPGSHAWMGLHGNEATILLHTGNSFIHLVLAWESGCSLGYQTELWLVLVPKLTRSDTRLCFTCRIHMTMCGDAGNTSSHCKHSWSSCCNGNHKSMAKHSQILHNLNTNNTCVHSSFYSTARTHNTILMSQKSLFMMFQL